jgi:inner membrane transporter RhtA
VRRLPPVVVCVVRSLEAAVGALGGVVVLLVHLLARAWVAIALVVLASAGAAGHRRPPTPSTPA